MTPNEPSKVMNNLVKYYNPLMVVLPYVTHSKIEQYLTSNSTLDILRSIKTPTLFVPPKARLENWQNIVFPSGFSEDVDSEFVR